MQALSFRSASSRVATRAVKKGTQKTAAKPVSESLWLPQTSRPEWLDGTLPKCSHLHLPFLDAPLEGHEISQDGV